jgi:hypothetical protein
MGVSSQNFLRRGRRLLRTLLFLFNTFVVICILLRQQMVKDDLSKPSYHLNENAEYLADFNPLCKGAGAESQSPMKGEG